VIESRAKMLQEIVLPLTSPETEWIRGRAVQKVSPTFDHGRVQAVLAAALLAWSPEHGVVATEWRFRIRPPGEIRRPLVPDLAFVAFDRLDGLSHAELQSPAFAPSVAFEVLSPGDVAADVASKIDTYLRGGSELVVVIDATQRRMRLHAGGTTTELRGPAVLEHPALPGLKLPIAPLFAAALDVPMHRAARGAPEL